MSKLRVGILGGGHLGTIHARLMQQHSEALLAGIFEPNEQRAAELRNEFACSVETDLQHFLEHARLDAAVIAAPTSKHHAIGLQLLEQGIHCLVEKPLALTVQECDDLVAKAQEKQCILQVGHVERFNPAWTTMLGSVGDPKLVEAFREAPLTFRSLDGGVILDLMIHDLDLVLSMVRASVVQIQATGFAWTGNAEDFAQARITFSNGTVANFTASRISTAAKREMRIWGADWYSEVDFGARTCHIVDAPTRTDLQRVKFSANEREELIGRLFQDVTPRTDLTVPEGNPILDEQTDLLTSIRTQSSPIVNGNAGRQAVAVANEIQNLVARRNAPLSEGRRELRRAG